MVSFKTDEIVSGDHRIRFAMQGQGPDVLLLHGTLMGLEDMMIGLADRLSNHFRVTALDRPGHGGSSRPRGQASFWTHASIIGQFAAEIGLKRPIVIGHSAGASTALALGLQMPERVTGIIALAPLVFPEPRIEQALFGPYTPIGFGDAWARAARPIAEGRMLPLLREAIFLPQRMPDVVREHFPFARFSTEEELITTGEDAMAAPIDLVRSLMSFPTCRVPLHLMTGEADRIVDPRIHAGTLALALPQARSTSIPGLGHMIHHFAQEQILEAALDMAGEAIEPAEMPMPEAVAVQQPQRSPAV